MSAESVNNFNKRTTLTIFATTLNKKNLEMTLSNEKI